VKRELPGGFELDDDRDRIDVDAVHDFIANHSYWAPGRPREVQEEFVRQAIRVVGLYDGDRQIGFARTVTDRATFAYLADVYVLESYRGQGLAKWMMRVIMAHPDLQGLRRFALATKDAHGLYAQFGFAPLARPDRHMEIVRPDVYRADRQAR
jgi:GNAT superfamily N-acetyltransferase